MSTVKQPSRWSDNFGNVLSFGRFLIENGEIETAREALLYFEKPWKWTDEWNEKQEHESACPQ